MSSYPNSKIKCYLSEVDEKFDPRKDIILGPWCLTSTSQSTGVCFTQPYKDSEKKKMFKQLFDLSFYLLNRDLRDIKDLSMQKEYYICNQSQYLYFVLYAFSKYRYIKNIFNENNIPENIIFENICVNENTLKGKFDPQIYRKPEIAGLLSFKIIECLYPKHRFKKFSRVKNIQELNDEDLDKAKFKETAYFKFKCFLRKWNYFSDVPGICFIKGLILSFIYFFFATKKQTHIDIYNPKIIFTNELKEFIGIYDKISEIFINKRKDLLYDIKKKRYRYKKLYFLPPSFMYSEKKIHEYAKAIIYGRSRGVIFQPYRTLLKYHMQYLFQKTYIRN